MTAATLATMCLQTGMTEEETCRLLHDNGYRPPEPVVAKAGMSRRQFLVNSAGAAIAAVAATSLPDPAEALWTPDKRRIFIDKPKQVRLATDREVRKMFEDLTKQRPYYGASRAGRRYGPYAYDVGSGKLVAEPTPQEVARLKKIGHL